MYTENHKTCLYLKFLPIWFIPDTPTQTIFEPLLIDYVLLHKKAFGVELSYFRCFMCCSLFYLFLFLLCEIACSGTPFTINIIVGLAILWESRTMKQKRSINYFHYILIIKSTFYLPFVCLAHHDWTKIPFSTNLFNILSSFFNQF